MVDYGATLIFLVLLFGSGAKTLRLFLHQVFVVRLLTSAGSVQFTALVLIGRLERSNWSISKQIHVFFFFLTADAGRRRWSGRRAAAAATRPVSQLAFSAPAVPLVPVRLWRRQRSSEGFTGPVGDMRCVLALPNLCTTYR